MSLSLISSKFVVIAFVCCALTPLTFIVLTHDIVEGEEEDLPANHEKEKYLQEFNKVDKPESSGMSRKMWEKYYRLINDAKLKLEYEELHQDPSYPSIKCHTFLNNLESDLKPWQETGISKELIQHATKLTGVHYQIIGHKLYRQQDCMFPSRCEGVEHFILNIINDLPDMDLIINVRDYPQVYQGRDKLPIMSFSKDVSSYLDILYPAWSFWCGGPAIEQYPTGIGRWDLMRLHISKQNLKWDDKDPVAFFRGSRTSSERDPLIRLSRQMPHMFDAKYTKNQAWRSIDDTLGEMPVPTIPLEEQCKYKYLFNMRGVAASFRYKHLFLCKSVVLNVDSNWIEFFYPQLKPWIHYVPIANSYDNALEVVTFLLENDGIAKEIATKGYQMIWDELTMEKVQCYWKELLLRYAKLLKYKPKLNTNLIKIKSVKNT